jgi:hypothetical protein
MRHCTISCDRCSSPISGGHSILEVKHGDLVKQFDQPLDLCAACSGDLMDFLRPPEPFKLESSTDGAGSDLRISGRAIGSETVV